MKNFLRLKLTVVFAGLIILNSSNVYAQPYPVHKYPYVTIKNNEFRIPASGMENIKVDLTSDTTWSTDIDADWLTRDKGIGSHDDSIFVTVYENTDDTARAATIKVSADGGPVQVEVKFFQASYNPVITAPRDTIYLGDTINWADTISIMSNTAWSVTSSAKWLNVSQANGINNTQVAIIAERNFTPDWRTATIIITADDVDTIFIPVKQAAGDTSLVSKDNAFRCVPDSSGNLFRFLYSDLSPIYSDRYKKQKYCYYIKECFRYCDIPCLKL